MVSINDIYRFSEKENRLTAQIMFTLERVDRNHFLKKFLDLCRLPSEDMDSIRFKLQEKESESIPDAVAYKGRSKLSFFESKLSSDISVEQIVAHVSSGKRRIPVVCITRGIRMPDGVKEALEQLGEEKQLVKWIGWRQIYGILTSLPKELRESDEISSMMKSLEDENLTGFTGFKVSEVSDLPVVAERYQGVVQSVSSLLEDVDGYVMAKDPAVKSCKFWRDGRAQKSVDVVTFCDLAFCYQGWADCGYYSTLEWVDKMGSLAGMRVSLIRGVVVIFGRIAFDTIKTTSVEAWKTMLEELSPSFQIYKMPVRSYDLEPIDDKEKFLEELAVADGLKVVDFIQGFPLDELAKIKPGEMIEILGGAILKILTVFRKAGAYTELKAP